MSEHDQTDHASSATPVSSLRSRFEAKPAQTGTAAASSTPASLRSIRPEQGQDLAALKASAAVKKKPPPPPTTRKPVLVDPRSTGQDNRARDSPTSTNAQTPDLSTLQISQALPSERQDGSEPAKAPEPVWHMRPTPPAPPSARQVRTHVREGAEAENSKRPKDMAPHGEKAGGNAQAEGHAAAARSQRESNYFSLRPASAARGSISSIGSAPVSPFETSFDDELQSSHARGNSSRFSMVHHESLPLPLPSPSLNHPPRISSQENRTSMHSRSRSSCSRGRDADFNLSRPTLPPRPGREPSVTAENANAIAIPAARRPERSALSQGFGGLASTTPPQLTATQNLMPAPDAGRTPPPRPASRVPQSYKADTRQREKSMDIPRPMNPGSANVTSEFPDSSAANRRPPNFRDGPKVIPTTYESRLFDVSGQNVCTSGTHTRVWNLLTGRLVLTMAHGEQVRANALAFKPTRKIDEEGTKVWIGNNWGEIQEVDVTSKRTTGLNQSAHARRELVKIYRNGAEMWSLDNEGKLIVWPAGDQGSPNLSDYVVNGRVPQGHSTSVVVDGQLWLANGRGIYVFQPSITPSESSFRVTPQALQAFGAGDTVSSAVVDSQPDKIFFGHTDGKVSTFSRKTHQHLQTCAVGLHRIGSLVGIGDSLWAGFSNGSIATFDTTSQPWKVKKQWQPHTAPVVNIVSDRNSLWKMGKWFVVSLGADNILGVWDGTLEDDFLGNRIRDSESQFCSFETLSAEVVTWNAGASKPSDFGYSKSDSFFFRDFLKRDKLPDLIVFGFQELVDLEDKKLTAKTLFKSRKQDSQGHEHLSSVYRTWRDYLGQCLDEFLDDTGGYVELHSASLVGLFSCIFVKSSIRHKVRDLRSFQVKTGMGGLHGNKGALIVSLFLQDSSVCFTNCHLAAGQTSTGQRNNDVASILGNAHLAPCRREDFTSYAFGGDGSMVGDHEICIFSGDMNYRIDALSREAIVNAIREESLQKLLHRDQLDISRRKDPTFRLRDFTELPITFNPTYKYDVGTDRYDTSEKRRAPAWCDRIMFRGPNTIQQLHYRRHEVRLSDHRPVTGSFKLRVKTADGGKRKACLQRCADDFGEHKAGLAHDARLEYLVSIFQMTREQASLHLAR